MVQGSVAIDALGPESVCVAVDCPICNRPHLIDPRTGRVPDNGSVANRKPS